MARIDRRKFLQSSGAGGLAGILASGRAPAFAQATTLHWLRLGDFVPASDTLLRRELLPEAEKALGFKITLETINGNDLQARIASSIQSGSGADLIHAMHNWPQLYAESLVDVSDVAEEIAKEQGGFYDIFPAIAKSERGWLAVPWAALGILLCYRKSWFDEIGVTQISRHLGELSGRRQAAQGEGPPDRADARARLQRRARLHLSVSLVVRRQGARGGRQDRRAQQQGDAGVGQVHGRLLEGCARRGRARLGRQQQQPRVPRRHDLVDQQRGLDLHRGAAQARAVPHRKGHAAQGRHPARALSEGPGRRAPPASAADPHADGLFEEPEGRQGFPALGDSRKVFEKWFVSQKGFSIPAAREWSKHAVWNEDPVMAPFRDVILTARAPGWPGPSSRKAAEVVSKYIITDMYAKAVQGMPAEDAVKWAHAELVKIYG